MELAVDVAADSDWGAHRLHVAFLDEQFLNSFAEETELPFGKTPALVKLSKPDVGVNLSTH